MPQHEYAAFISYAGADRARAEEVCAYLEAHGLRCWIAPRDVRGGREYAREIVVGIERSHTLVLILSAAANGSPFVTREVERAVAKGRSVVPVRLEDVRPASDLELFVSATHWIDVWQGDRGGQMDRIVAAVSEGGPVARPPEPRTALPASPVPATPSRARRWGLLAAAALLLVGVLAFLGYRYAAREAPPRGRTDAVVASPAPATSTPPVPSVGPGIGANGSTSAASPDGGPESRASSPRRAP